MKIKYHNRNQLLPEQEAKYHAEYCSSIHELLSGSDVISINCPLNVNTTALIGKAEFDAMKDGVYFVNTSRGPVVDEEAFKAALDSGKVARAGLDVFCNEPKIDTCSFTGAMTLSDLVRYTDSIILVVQTS